MKKLAFVLLIIACGGKSATTTNTPAEPTPVALPDLPFDKLDHEQKIEFMKQKVVPAMKPIFQKHDAQKYAEFGCVTCHGEEAKQGKFDMPNPSLPKIGYSQEFYAKFKPEQLQWMGQDVLPTMANLLGQTPSFTDPAPKDGYGCANCHTFDPNEKRPAQ